MSMNYDCVALLSAQPTEEAIPSPAISMSVQKEASSSMPTPCSCENAAEGFLVTDWNSLVSVDQDVDFNGSSSLSAYNVREQQCQGNNGLSTMVKQFPGPSPFNDASIPGSVNSFDMLRSNQAANALCHQDFYFTDNHGIDKNLKGKKRKNTSDYHAFHPHPLLDRIQTVEAEQQISVAPKSVKSPAEKTEKKQKSEATGGITHKPNAKHVKESSQDGDATEEDYLHVRAKRGQATNSHSLAERVRREKISKRMKLLQDLVPGCNKITGKAMMLDEIINYVQSLQRQVEFLSMKLAAVNPELPFDTDQIISKDILQSRGGNLALLGRGPGMSTSHPLLQGSSSHGIEQSKMLMCNLSNSVEMMRSSIPQISPMSQLPGVWDDELQTVLQMGFIPNPPVVGADLNGSMKLEL